MADDNRIVKFGLVGAALYFGYVWLKNSGFLGSSAQSFTDAASLLSYCAANPTASATYSGQTAACSAWLQAAGSSSASPAPVATSAQPPGATPSAPGSAPAVATPATPLTPVAVPPAGGHVTALTVAQLVAAATGDGYPADATTTFTVDQWNYFVSNFIDPNAVVNVDLSAYGASHTAPLTAAQYIAARQKAGLSGMASFRSPYGWGA